MNALVTGAAGFVGKHLVRRLRANGDHVTGVDLVPSVGCDSNLILDLANGCDEAVWHAQPEVVYHLAGMIRGNPIEVYRTNVLGTVALLEAVAKSAPAARVVLVGSAAEYQPQDREIAEDDPCTPTGAYGISKHAGILAGLDYHPRVEVVVVRPFNLVGRGLGSGLLASILIRQVMAGEKVRISNTARDFVAVEDVVDGMIKASLLGESGRVYNLCSGIPTRLTEVLAIVEELTGKTADAELLTDGSRDVWGSHDRATVELGWTPTKTLETSLREMVGA